MAGPDAGGFGVGVPVSVENGTSRTLRVYLLDAGEELLLGRVGALSTEELRVQNASSATIQLVARPSASSSDALRIVSQPVQLLRDHRVTWQLRESPGSVGPRTSTIRVFPCTEQDC
jgi:hypothetical protein